jgi:hypothetical protein
METLQTTLSIFGNPSLVLHRLLQGRWPAHKGHYSDADLISDQPLHHWVYILYDELLSLDTDYPSAISTLRAFCHSALNELQETFLQRTTSAFWSGLQYVLIKTAKKFNVALVPITREKIQDLILGNQQAEHVVGSIGG